MLDGLTRLTVVIPVKDDARQLERCLRLLAPQLSSLDQLIVVDNASTDDSGMVGLRFGATVIYEPIPGIAAASAAGYNAASGALVGRLDADSTPAADWIETIVAHFTRYPASAAVTGGAVFTDGPQSIRKLGAFVYLGAYFMTVSLALGHTPLFGSNCAFRREDWLRVRDSVHISDLMVHDDMDLSFHIGPLREIRYLPALRVGISSRPFLGGSRLLRVRRAFHTIFLHWPGQFPWLRLARRSFHLLREIVRR